MQSPTNVEDTRAGEGSMRLSAAFEAYRQDVIVFKAMSAKSEETNEITKRSIVAFLGDKQASDLVFNDVRRWKQHLDKGRSPSTVRTYILSLRVVLKHLKRLGIESLDAEAVAIPSRRDTVPEYVTPDVVKKLIAACDCKRAVKINKLRNRAIISTLYASGIRNSELCSLDRSQIKADRFTVVGKGGKARLCFLDDRAVFYIEEYLKERQDNHPALFINNQDFQRINCGTVQEVFKNVRKRAGIKSNVHPHTMRHSFATNLLSTNTNLYHVQQLLGHRSLQTTQQYLHVQNEDLAKIYREHHTI